MVIDDSMTIRVFVCANLGRYGYEIEPSSDAIVSIEVLKRSKLLPDIIFIEENMPKVNACAFTKILKEDKKLKNIHVFIITSHISEPDRKNAKNCGVEGFITKPFPVESLVEVIESKLGA